MRRLLYALALALPGGLLAATGALFVDVFEACKTGTASLDRWAIRGRLVFQLLKQFPEELVTPAKLIEHARAMMAILHNETRGDPKNYIGDDGLPAAGGASIGPGQVSFKTAQALGLVPASETLEDYKRRAPNEGWGMWAAVKVYRSKLQLTGGNIPLAIERYNGSGPHAEQYEADALAFEKAEYGIGDDAA